MDNAARKIQEIKELLAEVAPDDQRRVIDYLATTYRGELKELEDEPAPVRPEVDTRPSFLQTEARIDAGEVMLEIERQKAGKKKRR